MLVRRKAVASAVPPKMLMMMIIMSLTLSVEFTLQPDYMTIFFPAQVELALQDPMPRASYSNRVQNISIFIFRR
jgi:hypothetical protein